MDLMKTPTATRRGSAMASVRRRLCDGGCATAAVRRRKRRRYHQPNFRPFDLPKRQLEYINALVSLQKKADMVFRLPK